MSAASLVEVPLQHQREMDMATEEEQLGFTLPVVTLC